MHGSKSFEENAYACILIVFTYMIIINEVKCAYIISEHLIDLFQNCLDVENTCYTVSCTFQPKKIITVYI